MTQSCSTCSPQHPVLRGTATHPSRTAPQMASRVASRVVSRAGRWALACLARCAIDAIAARNPEGGHR